VLKKIRHLGIIVPDFDRAIEKFTGFGLDCSEVIEKKEYGMRIGFFPIGDTLIEVLQFKPDQGWDPMHAIVRSQKGALNHICFEVDDLEASIRDFEKKGPKLVVGCPRPGAHGRVAFFYPETTENVLIEICQV
jgi:methylmalonyl-CoA/ethylmalonyl-CoA epimerase